MKTVLWRRTVHLTFGAAAAGSGDAEGGAAFVDRAEEGGEVVPDGAGAGDRSAGKGTVEGVMSTLGFKGLEVGSGDRVGSRS